MKKLTLICALLLAFTITDAQVNVVRCTEDDYKKALRASIYRYFVSSVGLYCWGAHKAA